jgi:hypothetical protein
MRILRNVPSLAVILLCLLSSAAKGQQCTLPPGPAFNPYRYTPGSHTYNPYSSKDNAAANVNHEPKKPGENGHWVSKTYHVSCCSDSGLLKRRMSTLMWSTNLPKPWLPTEQACSSPMRAPLTRFILGLTAY